MKKFNLIILMVIIVSLIIWGISSVVVTPTTEKINESSPEQKILNFNLGSEPSTLDPQLNKDLYGGSLINNMFEGLFRRVNNHILPAIAKEYKISIDQLTYTFYLRASKWSDGTPLTAHDFEYAWKRALDPNIASEYAYQFFPIEGAKDYYHGNISSDQVGIQALDDFTLEVKLQTPTPYFIDLLTSFTFMPCKKEIVQYAQNGLWAIHAETAISNGPFMLKSYNKGDRIVLEKNPHYWDAIHVNLDMINVYLINDSVTALTAFENHEFDIIDSVPVAEIPKLMNEDSEFYVVPSLATAYYLFNVSVKPLDDFRIRQALSFAIDRKELVETVTKAGEIPAVGITPPGLVDTEGNDFYQISSYDAIDSDRPDIELARSLLAEAGYEDGENFPTLEILYNTSETNELLASAIQEMWRKNLNINVKLVNQEFAVFQTSKSQKNFQIARGSWFSDFADPLAMLEIWTSNNPINTTGWLNHQFDTLIEASKTAIGQMRYDLLYEAQMILMAELPIIPLYYYSDVFMVSKNVTNYDKTAMGLWYFGKTDITKWRNK
ncbi:peptide ABC transporter substrate-binding protein [Fusibacter bizertensis]